MTSTMNSVSVVIPVFNAAQTLETLHSQLDAAAETFASAFELILVDDGSTDESWSVIRALEARDPRVHGIQLGRNYGQHNALLCGIRVARFDVIVTMDDDLQNPVSEIPRLTQRVGEGYDVVYGTAEHKQFGLFRNLATGMTKLALSSMMQDNPVL